MTDILTGSEACDYLKVHRTYLPRLIAEGLLVARVGNRYRVRRVDLDAYLASRTLRAGGGTDDVRPGNVPNAGRRAMGGPGTGRTRRVPKRDRDRRAPGTRPVAGATEVGPEDLAFPVTKGRGAAA